MWEFWLPCVSPQSDATENAVVHIIFDNGKLIIFSLKMYSSQNLEPFSFMEKETLKADVSGSERKEQGRTRVMEDGRSAAIWRVRRTAHTKSNRALKLK